MSIARAGRRSVLVALALAFGLLLGGVTPASGQTQGQTGTLGNAGVLRLKLGPTDHLRFEPPTGSATTQSLTVGSQCRLSPASSSLANFSATGSGSAYPGFNGDAIGVKGGGEGQGTPCGRVDPGQTLTMDLGTGLDGRLIDFAEMDVELKGNATLVVSGYLVDESGATLMRQDSYFSDGSDSGPDSGDLDNYRIRFPKDGSKTTVNRLVFGIQSVGGVSLEGGSDGTGACDAADSPACPGLGATLDDNPGQTGIQATTDSLFHLVKVDGILDCGQTADPQGGGGTPLNSLVRLDNATGDPAECIPIPYDLDSSVIGTQQFTTLLKDLLGEDAQFEWTVTWVPEEGSYMEDETEFDFDLDGTFSPIQLCLADGPDPGVFPDLPESQEDPGTLDPWCVKKTETTLIVGGPDNGKVFVKETYYGKGDPTGRR